MAGPSYQQFQGYPNPVGNYFAGQDAGYGRAKEGFGDRQTLETQNALVQQSGAQSYPQLQAQQMQAKQMMEMYTPILKSAWDNKNTELIKKISEVYQQSNNPLLQKLAGALGSLKILDKGKYTVRYKADTPEEMAALKKAMPSLANHPQIQPGVEYEFNLEGGWGDPNTMVHSALPVETKNAGANKPVAISSEAQVRPLIMDLPPQIADEILRTVRDPANKGKVIYFETGSGGKLTGRVHKFGPAPSTGGFGSSWALTPAETAALTRAIDEKRLNPNKVNSRTAKVYAGMELEKPGMSFAGKAADIEADSKSLGNQQKIRDMMASFVLNMNAQIDRVDEIKKDLARTDVRLLNIPIRQLGMRVKGSAIESKVSMYLTEISNEIGKLSTGSAASVAELSLGAQKKWDKIHDPNLSIKDLISLLKETQHAGNLRMQSIDSTLSSTKGRLKGKTAGPGLDAYIKAAVAKYPQFKTKTRVEWQAAYDKKYGGGQ